MKTLQHRLMVFADKPGASFPNKAVSALDHRQTRRP
jgi:hypothetical protein